jgi:hypothetical protein
MLSAPPGSPRAWPRLGLKTKSRTTAGATSAAPDPSRVGTSTRFSQSEFTPVRLPTRVSFYPDQHPALIDAETWSPGARFAISSPPMRAAINPKAMQPSRACLRAAGRCPRPVESDLLGHTPSRKGAAIAITSLPRRSPGRNGSQARLGRYAPSSGKCHVAPAVTLGAISRHSTVANLAGDSGVRLT